MKFIGKIKAFMQKLDEDNIGEYTAQCAYYTLLSFIPFIILLLSLIKYMHIDKDTLTFVLEAILPNVMKNSILDIIQEVYSKSLETVSISVVFILWSASKSFYALNKGLSKIYNREENENYILGRIKGVVGAIIALVIVILILVLLVFGNIIKTIINEKFQELNEIIEFILNAKDIISIISTFLIFFFMYKIKLGKKGRGIKNCALGAAFTSISWYLISLFFSIYVDIFTNFSIIYGSLATIILIMTWLYAIIYAILVGAEISNKNL